MATYRIHANGVTGAAHSISTAAERQIPWEKKMSEKQKVTSLRVLFDGEEHDLFVMVGTEDIDTANQIAAEWAEKEVGKKANEVVINKGIIDMPSLDADDEYKGYLIWELSF